MRSPFLLILFPLLLATACPGGDDPVSTVSTKVLRGPGKDAGATAYQTVGVKQLSTCVPRSIPLGKFGGRSDRAEKATGFFYALQQPDGWTFVDPQGHPFISMGVNSVSPGEKDEDSRAAFNEKFKSKEAWTQKTHALLALDLNFNTLGCWSDWEAFVKAGHPMPYTLRWNFMAGYGRQKKVTSPGSGHVNFQGDCIPVFDPEFETFCAKSADSIKQTAGDPWLLGHFTDNELPLKRDNILKRYLALSEGDPGRDAARQWLEKKGKTPQQINNDDDNEFCRAVLTRYYRIVHDVLKKHDPNHLILGTRVHGGVASQDVTYEASGPYVDVVSINYYHRWSLEQQRLSRLSKLAGKPLLISEWYAKAMDTGLANDQGAGFIVATQADRAAFYQNFTLGALRNPCVVGWHWFRYRDDGPASANKGIVSLQYEPYAPLAAAMREVNQNAYSLRDFMRQLQSSRFPQKPEPMRP